MIGSAPYLLGSAEADDRGGARGLVVTSDDGSQPETMEQFLTEGRLRVDPRRADRGERMR